MVTSRKLLLGNECLIGMDILTQGDLAITNANNETCVSFRIPSEQCIDFVQEYNDKYHSPAKSDKHPGRNDQCPCGSGEKYKNCHGKGL